MKQAKHAKTHKQNNKEISNQKIFEIKGKGNNLVFMIFLFFFSFFLYGQSIQFDFAMDDNIMIRLNKSVQKGTDGFGELFTTSMVYGSNGKNAGAYRPITMMSFALDKQLFNNNPKAFHFINVLLYAVTSFFLFLLLRAFFPSWHGMYPFMISLLFIAHPIHTEVVANIKSRDEILSFLFTILAMLVMYKSNQRNQVIGMVGSFVLFLLGCLSKETALTFVAVIPMSYYFFTKLPIKKILINSIPFFAGAAVYMILRISFLDSMGSSGKIGILDNTLMAATNEAEKYATIIFITWKYLLLLVFPHPLSWDYSFRQIPICSFDEIRVLLPLFLFTGLIVFAFISFRKKNIFSFCIFFFFLTLALVSNIFIPIAATMAERFLYFPSLAFCMALVYACIKLFKTDTRFFLPSKQYLLFLTWFVILTSYSFKTYSHTRVWKNNLSLFESGVISSPNSSRTHSSLAYEYAVQAEQSKVPHIQREFYSKSIESFKTALKLYDGNKEGWYNIAHTYDIMGEFNQAESYYRKAIEVDPRAANSYNNLGAIYLRQNKYEAAKDLFRQAILLDKYYADPLGNLGAAYHFEGNFAEAIKYYEQALVINPNLQTVLNNIAKAKQSYATQSAKVNSAQ